MAYLCNVRMTQGYGAGAGANKGYGAKPNGN